MAKKKTVRKKTSFAFKKTAPKTFRKVVMHPEVKNGVWSILLIAAALLSMLSFFDKAGVLGNLVEEFLSVLFGWGMYITPLILIAVSVAFIFSWKRNASKSIVFAAILFTASLLGVLSIGDFSNAVERGGWLGFLYTWPLVHFLSTPGAVVVLISGFIISILLGFHIPLGSIFEKRYERRKSHKTALVLDVDKKSKRKKYTAQTLDIKTGDQSKEIADSKDLKKEKKLARAKGKRGLSDDKASKNDFLEVPISGKFANFELPSMDLLDKETGKPTSGNIVANANIIKRTLENFGIDVEIGEVNVGPTVTQYTLKPAEGVKLSRITALGNDLSLALAAHPIRIEAPIPGRSVIGVEIPNKLATWVRLRNLLEHKNFAENKNHLILALGRDVKGAPIYDSLTRMPHMLVAGSTGSGKTIALNAIIMSLLYRNTPQMLRFILIDPKRVEFSVYAGIPHLLAPIVVDSNKAINALKWVVGEMERRFEVLAGEKTRDIGSYNNQKKIIEDGNILPYIVVVIDELADLMSSKGRDVEALIVRIAQMARAVGIHLVLATQRPSVEVITGLIKANITARMAFQVASQVDSRTILDGAGAEKLLGRGDMLYLAPEASKPKRIQGAFIGEREVYKVAEHLRAQKEKMERESGDALEVEDFESKPTSPIDNVDFDNLEPQTDDELYVQAKDLVIKAKKASASYLQRRLRIGYARAARLLDMLEENGVIGPGEGAKPREVFIQFDEDGELGGVEDTENKF